MAAVWERRSVDKAVSDSKLVLIEKEDNVTGIFTKPDVASVRGALQVYASAGVIPGMDYFKAHNVFINNIFSDAQFSEGKKSFTFSYDDNLEVPQNLRGEDFTLKFFRNEWLLLPQNPNNKVLLETIAEDLGTSAYSESASLTMQFSPIQNGLYAISLHDMLGGMLEKQDIARIGASIEQQVESTNSFTIKVEDKDSLPGIRFVISMPHAGFYGEEGSAIYAKVLSSKDARVIGEVRRIRGGKQDYDFGTAEIKMNFYLSGRKPYTSAQVAGLIQQRNDLFKQIVNKYL